ncbi:MAG: hypothetical protein V3R84_05345 [Acidimicrobiia bacterium]
MNEAIRLLVDGRHLEGCRHLVGRDVEELEPDRSVEPVAEIVRKLIH